VQTLNFFPNYFFKEQNLIKTINWAISRSEIFVESQCNIHESHLISSISEVLVTNGYVQSPYNLKVWTNGKKKVILSLVDDYRQCALSMPADQVNDINCTQTMFDSDTLVITDNYVTCPTLYSIFRVPKSFFGIYSYRPTGQPSVVGKKEFNPLKDLFFSVNRIDRTRMFLYFEFMLAYGNLDFFSHAAHINFNCDISGNRGKDITERVKFFNSIWQNLDDQYHINRYQQCYDLTKDNIPYLNYNQNFDTMMYQSWINVVIETYSNDYVIALSEKIFRALVTPAPWMVFASTNTVFYLQSLGFDVMDDLMKHHCYDNEAFNCANGSEKK